jgi:hypothetical protein
MRFLLMHKIDERRPDAYDPSPEFIAKMGQFIGEVAQTGALLAADGLTHSANGARVVVRDGKRDVIDGPFTEAKEVIGGYAIVQYDSKQEAIDMASRFADLFGHDIEVEVRQMPDEAPSA